MAKMQPWDQLNNATDSSFGLKVSKIRLKEREEKSIKINSTIIG